MIFDIIFITQHYILYRSARGKIEGEEEDDWEAEQRPLIDREE
jgi:hypothetical protein